MIMPGSIGVSPEGRGLPTQLSLFDEKQVAGHKRLVDAIHSKGSLVAAQLYHACRQASEAITGLDPLALQPFLVEFYKIIQKKLLMNKWIVLKNNLDKQQDGLLKQDMIL